MKNNKTHEDIIQSASVTSMMRFLLSKDNETVPNPDNYGQYFVAGKWKVFLDDIDFSKKEMQKKLPGCMYYHLIRTKRFDDALLSWVKENPGSQVIILGAGFDSRSMRFKNLLDDNDISIYEIDLKAMLEHKNNVMLVNKLTPCNKHFFVPCNFNDESTISCLKKRQGDLDKNTLILWEGVTYFLPEELIKSILIEFKDAFKGKLQITLDYAFRSYIEGDLNYYGAKELYDVLIEIGEPHYFGLNYKESECFFSELGYESKKNYTAMMLESLYLRDNFGVSAGLPHVFNAMVDIIKRD